MTIKNLTSFSQPAAALLPVISIIKTILHKEPVSTITLVYGNRNASSIIFKEEIKALKDLHLKRFRLYHVLSRERTEADINYGRIDNAKCEQFSKLIDYASADEIFICGPEQMIFSVKDFLVSKGIEPRKIHFELFTTPTRKHTKIYESAGVNNEEGSEITVKLDAAAFNFKLDYNTNNILDAALAEALIFRFRVKVAFAALANQSLWKAKWKWK